MFPHQRLIAYQVALEFATAVGALRITDARIREQARKSTISCVLNIAEGAGRRSRADKSRVYAIALGELCEAAAAIELAVALRAANVNHAQAFPISRSPKPDPTATISEPDDLAVGFARGNGRSMLERQQARAIR